ncbi:MAG TPA: type II toxin-antitoxin system PemK/MazF family toxin [Ignavibacteria bacterium]|nr:type II toxin-antitoxin system PemK/MazF family toxin [Ignavibacteria bacterium]
MVIYRFEVYFVNLDPAKGSEINKGRPCVVISPNEMNKYLKTVIVAPMTSTLKGYASRIGCKFKGKKGEIALDQVRTVDRGRLITKMGRINEETAANVLSRLQEIFSW